MRYVFHIYAKKRGEEASSSINKSLKRITGISADKGGGDKINTKDIMASEEKLVDLTSLSKALSSDNTKKKTVAVKTEGTEYVDNLKVKKIRCENALTLLSNLL